MSELPVGSLREAATHLRRPFTPEAVKFKVQTVFKQDKGCIVVAYIDARLVIERLNAVCPELWHAEYKALSDPKLLLCTLTVDGVPRQDVGQSPKGLSKDLFSDALKRAAVHFGVGVSVYALPQITLYMNDSKGRIELRGQGEKQAVALTEHGHAKLREGYAQWLERDHGFGAPLSHGDLEGQTIDPDEDAEDAFVPQAPAALEDERAAALIAEAEALYDGIDKTVVPPQRFNAWLTGARHSHEELERLVAYLREKAEAAA